MGTSNWYEKSVIFKQSEDSQKFYIVKSGEVLCLKLFKERLIPIFLAKAGDILGESAMISGATYDYSAICLEPVELHEIPAHNFKEIFREAPEWIGQLMATMINRYQQTSNFIAENRAIDNDVISEEYYTPQMENEFKKLISNKIE